MKALQLTPFLIIQIMFTMITVFQNGPATAQSPTTFDTKMPPIIITQVELWGPISYYVDDVKICGQKNNSLGPWALGWIELYNTRNDTEMVNDFNFGDQGYESEYPPITIDPHEYCYMVTHGRLNTRVGVGGSLGNDAPPHDNSTMTIDYSVEPFSGKFLYRYSTPKLSDDYGDTRTWQLVNGSWVFQDVNIRHEFPTRATWLSPSIQTDSGINAKDLRCTIGHVVIVKKSDPTNPYLLGSPACVTPSSASKLVERGWGVQETSLPIRNTNSTVTYYAEGSKIEQVNFDKTSERVTLDLDTKGEGKMILFLPRSLIDSSQVGDYTLFNVTEDGVKIDPHERLTPTDRMFLILYPNGTKNIEITPKPLSCCQD